MQRLIKAKFYPRLHDIFFEHHIKLIAERKNHFHGMTRNQRGTHLLKEGIAGWGIYYFDRSKWA